MKWIQTDGTPLIFMKRNEADKWGALLNSDYEKAEKISFGDYISKMECKAQTVLVLGDEAMLTTFHVVDKQMCIIRWRFAPSIEIAELTIARLKLDEAILQETLNVEITSGDFVVFDAIETFSECIPKLDIHLSYNVNKILTYGYYNNDVSFIIHLLKSIVR